MSSEQAYAKNWKTWNRNPYKAEQLGTAPQRKSGAREYFRARTRSSCQQIVEKDGQAGNWKKVFFNDHPVSVTWSSMFCYRNLQIKLDQPVSAPPSPRDLSNGDNAPTASTPEQLTSHIQWLRNEVARLKHQLTSSLQERKLTFTN